MRAIELCRSIVVGFVVGVVFAAVPAGAADRAAIRVCTHSAPGFLTRDADGVPSGLEFDILTSFASATNRDVTFDEEPSFAQLLDDTEAGRCDIGAATVEVTAGRKARLLFSAPYFPNRVVVVARKTAGLAQQTDLSGRRVAVVEGTVSTQLISGISGAQAVSVRDDDAAFAALADDVVDALACDSAVVLDHLARHPELAVAFPLGERSFFAFALPKGSNLGEPLDRHLEELARSGQLAKLLGKYFGASNGEFLAAEIATGDDD